MYPHQVLLDFSRPFDVSLMDKVAMTFYTGAGQEVRAAFVENRVNSWFMQQQMAQLVLTQFEEHPESWTRVPEILEKSSFPQAKVRYDSFRNSCVSLMSQFIGLQILERLVTTRWKTLPDSQRQGASHLRHRTSDDHNLPRYP
jgi:exportin-1